jgi:hypothetical protein
MPVAVKARRNEVCCWYQPDIKCAFSPSVLRGNEVAEATVKEVSQIHIECGKAATHQHET